jgi:predicted acyl esterase
MPGIVARHERRRRLVSTARRLEPMTEARPAPEPRFEVEVDWDTRITVRDGTELSANIWRPVPSAGEANDGFPAILEMIP